VRELVHETICTIVVAPRLAELRGTTGKITALLRILRLIRIAHEVSGIAIARIRLLGAPDFLLAVLVREDGLWEGGRRGGKLAAGLSSAVLIAVIVEAEIQLETILLGVGAHVGLLRCLQCVCSCESTRPYWIRGGRRVRKRPWVCEGLRRMLDLWRERTEVAVSSGVLGGSRGEDRWWRTGTGKSQAGPPEGRAKTQLATTVDEKTSKTPPIAARSLSLAAR
jgi:hypothetical protein